jgi:phosphate starvation-inducible PhoH-like protein
MTMANPLTVALRDLGLAGTNSGSTFVPDEYLTNSADVRLAVLQGLLDSDGGPARQRGRASRIRYTTYSDRLRDDVTFLVRSLGGVAYARTRKAKGRAPGRAGGRPVWHRHDAHILDIRLPAGVMPFRLARKRRLYDAGGGRPMRMIDSIEPEGTRECVCIAVAAADSLYVTEDFLVTHNTLNDAFIILDEAQNTTPEQMKMFLTRLGFSSKMVVTGDVTQTDLPGGTRSGLNEAQEVLAGIDDVAFLRLTSKDVVRHRLVSEIVDAYGRHDNERASAAQAAQGGGHKGGRRAPERR